MKRTIQRLLSACVTVMLCALPFGAQTGSEGSIVAYCVLSPTREGDVDRREHILFSVPADTFGRIHARLFETEILGRMILLMADRRTL